ncbi:hypothetical protein SAMN05192557_1854, partial [Aliicoccus persicus]
LAAHFEPLAVRQLSFFALAAHFGPPAMRQLVFFSLPHCESFKMFLSTRFRPREYRFTNQNGTQHTNSSSIVPLFTHITVPHLRKNTTQKKCSSGNGNHHLWNTLISIYLVVLCHRENCTLQFFKCFFIFCCQII